MRSFSFTAVAVCVMAGPALSADVPEELKGLCVRADCGDPKAQLDLAYHYRDGKGVAKDEVEDMRWARRAADGGNPDAMDFVGLCYLCGSVVSRNPVIAFGYFKAAAAASAQAVFNLGQRYFGAHGTVQDVPSALDWWEKAATQGHGRAAATAAMVYLSGEGVAPDAARGRRLAERAAELNNPSGLVVLGELQIQAGDLDAARVSWTKASKLLSTAATGHPVQPSDNDSRGRHSSSIDRDVPDQATLWCPLFLCSLDTR